MFSHFQDIATKVSMVGSNGVMGAKRTVKGTHIGTKEPGAPFNLETKRLNVGWMEGAFNKIDFVEWGQGHLHILSSFIEIDGIRFKFSLEERNIRRRRLDIREEET